RFLEAEAQFQKNINPELDQKEQDWSRAIDAIEMARAVLGAAPDLVLRLNLMLADCHARMGSDDLRLEALRQAAERDQGGDAARAVLAGVLAQSGQIDQAISILSSLAVAGNNPQWRLDLVRLLLQKTMRLPRNRRNWQEVEVYLGDAEKALPKET